MKHMSTRKIQNLLKDTQIKLAACAIPEVRDGYKKLISNLASELLFRYQLDK
jgi:hypothetical protein